MQVTYRSAPTMQCYAPAKVFHDAVAALLYARQSADAFRVGYGVYRVLAGRLLHLWTFPAPDRRA